MTSKAIIFCLKPSSDQSVISRIQIRLAKAEVHDQVQISLLESTYYAEPFTTWRAVRRAVGILRGFAQIDPDSITIVRRDSIAARFNQARLREERAQLPHATKPHATKPDHSRSA